MQATEQATEMTRIDVQTIPNSNEAHIYTIGRAFYSTASYTSNSYACVYDIYVPDITSPSSTSFTVNEEFSSVFIFTDLTVTDNNLVVVGNKNWNNGQYMYKLPLPNAGVSSIFTLPSFPITYYAADNAAYMPQEEILIEHLWGDRFAIACIAKTSQWTDYTVSCYDDVGIPTDRCRIFVPNNTTVAELRYNQWTKQLAMLPYYSAINPSNIFYSISILNAGAAPNIGQITYSQDLTTFEYIYSLDAEFQYSVNEFFLVGRDNSGRLTCWDYFPTNSHCKNSATFNAPHFYAYEGKS